MTILLNKVVALGGLCALLAGTGTAAFAQGYGDHQDRHFDQAQGRHDWHHGQAVTQSERLRLARLHRVYTKDARSGHYGAAERAHLHAQAIRQDLRAQHHDMHQDRQDHHDDRGY